MILDLLFPKYCLECKKLGKYICDGCYCKVRPCNIIDNNYSIFKYEGVIRKAIISLKYKFAFDLVDELVSCVLRVLKINSKFLIFTASPVINSKLILVPIPLHKHRENWRGFNQAEIIGEKLAKKMNWKYIPDLLIRTKESKPQVQLKGLDRRKNLSGVFVVNTNHFISNNCSLVLFDDVYTTGSTINEAKKVLQESGFKNIQSLTIAR
ncbi:MAG: hypothetical protein UR39_C0005G0006 [Candidatus Woesebacteria bacterium GW2011_GWA1_33_30]|uniref:Phosphoribosyltransferase n=1 Tax=Candidatus Woesebacteria bacterium GW2011_GWA2_33_28 TaxID=1618561 RepID=A0A0F9ZSF7_9BACT|nr:MAG: hypothetical protein UR38_C0005G0006 [Candidatus Woesebacteria bacterium GW2011_GWA2_33_28]KKP48124.1 MAG: hypothetical protein UR39_C0005G0006 [Candidatus Woesebacteria bacterium GW2011_GWA1_33_30]KKP49366.1 MAG: Phosphoribosyltransferase [Microgenomates group bacterium GW2011_GWC1_33_32]KKP52092.1 MAG: hypothetical protein UR44_C0004G0006 [Candidatus Woesebacteria bacterium GW2011_GWB1_33_38]